MEYVYGTAEIDGVIRENLKVIGGPKLEEGEYLTNPALVHAMENAKKPGAALHLMGLLSDGGVHSHIRHLFGLLEMAKKNGVEKVFIHCFMDGRDTDPKSGKGFIEELSAHCEKSAGKIASIIGRYYAMDRDKRWERVKEAYDLLVNGVGTVSYTHLTLPTTSRV